MFPIPKLQEMNDIHSVYIDNVDGEDGLILSACYSYDFVNVSVSTLRESSDFFVFATEKRNHFLLSLTSFHLIL